MTTHSKLERPAVEQSLARIFDAGAEEHFEDGMLSNFSVRLLDCIDDYGVVGVEVLTQFLANPAGNPTVIAEALRWLPRVNQPATYEMRRELLEQSLSSPHPAVRDGALLGIAAMDDAHSVDFVVRAIADEPIPELRADMEVVLEQLAETSIGN